MKDFILNTSMVGETMTQEDEPAVPIELQAPTAVFNPAAQYYSQCIMERGLYGNDEPLPEIDERLTQPFTYNPEVWSEHELIAAVEKAFPVKEIVKKSV